MNEILHACHIYPARRYWNTIPPQDREDALQEVALELLKYPANSPPLRARVARNALRRFLRQSQRHQCLGTLNPNIPETRSPETPDPFEVYLDPNHREKLRDFLYVPGHGKSGRDSGPNMTTVARSHGHGTRQGYSEACLRLLSSYKVQYERSDDC